MRIVNIHAERICACAAFEYKGFEVSMSTIFGPIRAEVCVFKAEQLVKPQELGESANFPSVEAALAWIDRTVAGERMEANCRTRELNRS